MVPPHLSPLRPFDRDDLRALPGQHTGPTGERFDRDAVERVVEPIAFPGG